MSHDGADLARSSTPPKRVRNAAATREAILRSAVIAFTRHGYDGVGVREIAQSAGVTAMLVNRYFGSKEQLFTEAVDTAFAPRTVLSDNPATLAGDVAARLVERTAPESEHLDPFLLMLRSASNPRAAEIVRAGVERHAGRYLSELLEGPDADERAMLAHSVIAGFWLMRKMLGSTALVTADPDELTRRLEALLVIALSPSREK
ncbi:TetR family transcriptional regulator [Rhodococcus sp. ACS1]|jgi:AcrR family transcriptional regulator|uniref:TetR/AcrR family transcriptional regulator n=1 Tax=Rhodococcus TaxID=1827 RepID=UPI000BB13534|nr:MULTISPECIES: TetR/AcrR family transcriptional regulator [Rhodococcus]PBC50018.1 TetR family transcriptional regulator [Rhodococcus sp. ACS1]QSE80733.1 TetR family transcriptional regulator [Rhodococcus koreensis]